MQIPVAVVTGGTGGIGRAIIRRLSQEGLFCVFVASSLDSLKNVDPNTQFSLTREISGNIHRGLSINLAKWPDWSTQKEFEGFEYRLTKMGKSGSSSPVWQLTEGQFPLFPKNDNDDKSQQYRVNLLVNCAGVTQQSLSIRTPERSIGELINVNLLSSITLSNFTLKRMMRELRYRGKQSGFPSPCVINISSLLAQPNFTIQGSSVYAASKAGLSQYTRVLAKEVTPLGIRAAFLEPGLVLDTPMTDDLLRNPTTRRLLEACPTTTAADVADQVWRTFTEEGRAEVSPGLAES